MATLSALSLDTDCEEPAEGCSTTGGMNKWMNNGYLTVERNLWCFVLAIDNLLPVLLCLHVRSTVDIWGGYSSVHWALSSTFPFSTDLVEPCLMKRNILVSCKLKEEDRFCLVRRLWACRLFQGVAPRGHLPSALVYCRNHSVKQLCLGESKDVQFSVLFYATHSISTLRKGTQFPCHILLPVTFVPYNSSLVVSTSHVTFKQRLNCALCHLYFTDCAVCALSCFCSWSFVLVLGLLPY